MDKAYCGTDLAIGHPSLAQQQDESRSAHSLQNRPRIGTPDPDTFRGSPDAYHNCSVVKATVHKTANYSGIWHGNSARAC